MDITYVGEWIEQGEHPNVSEERMVVDLAYMFVHSDEFEDWFDLFNDGCDTYVVSTGKDRLDLLNAMSVYIREDGNAKVYQM